jgi:predicted nucleotidyltransferase
MRVQNLDAVRAFAVQTAADDRVLAAFLGGSLAKGTDDAFSDLDLYVVAHPETYDALVSDHAGLLPAMGTPLYHHVTADFEGLGFLMVHFALEGGVSGEIAICHPRSMMRTHGGPYQVLHDPERILAGVVFPLAPLEGAAQDQARVAQGEPFHYQLAKIVAHVARAPAARRDEAIRALRRAADTLERAKRQGAP